MKKISFFASEVALMFAFALLASSLMAFSDVFAGSVGTAGSTGSADENALTGTLCNVLKIVTGAAGKAFAAFAIISVGIGFFTGKVSWGLMIGVAAGIAAMFGAPTIVAAISGSSSFNCNYTDVIGS